MHRRLLPVVMMFATLSLLGAWACIASAQDNNDNREGQVEVGVRQLYGDRSSAKFNEYRDIPQGVFIKSGDVQLDELFHNRFFFSLQARDATEEDQTFLVRLGAYRKYKVDLKWDQIPHVFTNTARSFLTETSPGVFVASPGTRAAFAAAGTDVNTLSATLNGFPLVPMSLRRDKGSGELTLTPETDWTVMMGYSHEKMYGHRPFGTTTNGLTNIIELPEPIDYRTNKVNAGAEYADKKFVFQTEYDGSFFHNNVDTLTWDLPFAVTGTNSGQGRLDLYPSNNAQNFTFAGGVDIPYKTRLMASVAPGWMHQNDAFIPPTINPLLGAIAPYPASSLNGAKQTLAMNYTLSNKSIPKFPLTLRYTSYNYNNNTPSLTFNQIVVAENGISGPHTYLTPGYDRKDLDLEATWQFRKNSSVKFLYNWERYDRQQREVNQSNENTFGTSVDYNPYNWFLLRGTYRHGDRSPDKYVGIATDIPSLQKYDETGRKRDRAEGLLQLTPLDKWSFTASYDTDQNSYQNKGCVWLGYDQCYGLLKAISYDYSFELSYDPNPKLSLYAEYTKEKYNRRQLNRQRSGTNDTPNNDWSTTMRDKVDSYSAGLTATLYPNVVLDVWYTLSAAINKINTRALGNPALPGFLVTTAVPFPGVSDYPDSSNRWHQMDATLKFPLLSGKLTPKLEYRFEKYDRVDFQLVNVGQYFTDPQLTSSLFLGVGADVPGYDAHIVSASLEYRF